MGICKLCGKEAQLKASHIIPKFVINWIKATSATGYLRKVVNPNLRKQDIDKKKLLCESCEQKFSRYEKYFSNRIFYPHLNDKKTYFIHNNLLKRFIISLSWRQIVITDLEIYKIVHPEMYPLVISAEKYWRDILLNDKNDNKFEHHLFFFDYIDNSTIKIPPKFQAYLMRTVDGTIGSSTKEVFIFTKFPGMSFCSLINPCKQPYCRSTNVRDEGILFVPQTYCHPGFGEFLTSRGEIFQRYPLSVRQTTKIMNSISSNPGKFITSKSFESFLEDEKLEK